MWDELGIPPCHDQKTIRRAYAARLKKLDPDREPAAFARLRHAFEQALHEAARRCRSASHRR
jgi:curved DNA-binding protein CbpA